MAIRRLSGFCSPRERTRTSAILKTGEVMPHLATLRRMREGNTQCVRLLLDPPNLRARGYAVVRCQARDEL